MLSVCVPGRMSGGGEWRGGWDEVKWGLYGIKTNFISISTAHLPIGDNKRGKQICEKGGGGGGGI